MVKQKWIDLLNEDVYERLCNCCSRKSDILPLTQAKWSFFKDKKDYDKEQALAEVLELLDCNSQFFDLSATEYGNILSEIV